MADLARATVVPALRRAIEREWVVRDAEAVVRLMEAHEKVLPRVVILEVAEMAVLPRI